MTHYRITEEPVDSLNFSPNNPNVGDVASIADSIKEFGFGDVVIAVDEGRRVIAGEHRVKAARKQGVETVPVFWVSFDDASKADAYMLADNNIASHSIWDVPKLMDISERFASFDGLPFNSPEELGSFAINQKTLNNVTIAVTIGDFQFNVSTENWASWEETLRYEASETSTDAVTLIKERLGLL